MAFLHCHSCDFSQDDFWTETYNPITFLEKNFTKELLEADLDEEMKIDKYFLQEAGYDPEKKITRRELLAHELERHAETIRGMKYRTNEEFKEKNPNWICPECGERSLDID